jgi:hypothetical protein
MATVSVSEKPLHLTQTHVLARPGGSKGSVRALRRARALRKKIQDRTQRACLYRAEVAGKVGVREAVQATRDRIIAAIVAAYPRDAEEGPRQRTPRAPSP